MSAKGKHLQCHGRRGKGTGFAGREKTGSRVMSKMGDEYKHAAQDLLVGFG